MPISLPQPDYESQNLYDLKQKEIRARNQGEKRY